MKTIQLQKDNFFKQIAKFVSALKTNPPTLSSTATAATPVSTTDAMELMNS